MRLLSFDNSLSGFKLFLGESGYLGGVGPVYRILDSVLIAEGYGHGADALKRALTGDLGTT